MKHTASRYVDTVTVTDPDTKQPVELEIRKLENSTALVGIETSFLEDDTMDVYDPYNPNTIVDIPDQEDAL